MQVDVDGVETDQEVTENVLLGLGNVGQEGRDDGLAARELLADGQEELEGLFVDISNIHTALATDQHYSALFPLLHFTREKTYWVKRIQSPSRTELIQT